MNLLCYLCGCSFSVEVIVLTLSCSPVYGDIDSTVCKQRSYARKKQYRCSPQNRIVSYFCYGHWVAKWACRGHVTKTYRLWRIFLNKSALLSCLLQISQRSFDKSSFTKFQVITSPMEITRHILFFLILHIWAFYCYANVTSFKVRESELN